MMRRLLPSLSMRLFLIVLGGVVLAIAVSNAFHFHDRARIIEEYRERASIEHLADALRLLAELPPQTRIAAVVHALPKGEWSIRDGGEADKAVGEAMPDIAQALAERLGDGIRVEEAWQERVAPCDEDAACPRKLSVLASLPQGQRVWLGYTPKFHGRFHRERTGFRDRDILLVSIMAIVAWLVVRLALRPLQQMAQAAENVGRDLAHPPLDESGPIEVRRAAHAFNAMQQDIRANLAERTQILAAVTHDLKTPLTRMRLRLENCADTALRDKLRGDLAAMQTLVEEGLELARSLDSAEASRAIDLDALLQSLCEDSAEAGLRVAYSGLAEASVVVAGKPDALVRVFANLIDNAIKYGQYARVSLERRDEMAYVHVRDGGPGIPEQRLQDVLKPFVRLEESRSRETGGTGLGLAIAVNLLRTQQGQLELRNHPDGGLEVTVRLPVPAKIPAPP